VEDIKMLKVVNLEKHYKSKKGPNCHALKGINLEFGTRGFVFILGKSGSGKSTLLNIMGGLDKFDSGDIIIKGKSSKDFSAEAWDSYRNTYLGFVFQEFNLINDYSISKNIRLALELQSYPKKNIKNKVKEILKKVELEDVGNRKPSELSGGQKQRIAIARALVKDPEIIFADEPTGNLDSQTGKQVLDIMKKLSEEKLVIMVSHDIESAYRYADRIITMQDGMVVSDELNDSGSKYIGTNVAQFRTEGKIQTVIRLPKGSQITEEEVNEINNTIRRNNAVIYIPISNNRQLTKNDITAVNRYAKEQNVDIFLPLINDIQKIEGTTDEKYKNRVNPALEGLTDDFTPFKLIKSKLTFNNSLSMAVSSIWSKKIRVLFNILLFLIALTMFGFSETVTRFDFAQSAANSYELGKIDLISLNNTIEAYEHDRIKKVSAPFPINEIDLLMSKFDQLTYGKGYNLLKAIKLQNDVIELVKPKEIVGFLEIKSLSDLGLSILHGSFPNTFRDIAITDYIATFYINNDAEYSKIEDLIGTEILLDYVKYNISGIIETDYSDYLYLNNYSPAQLSELPLDVSNFERKNNILYSRIVVKDGFYNEHSKNIHAVSEIVNLQVSKKVPQSEWDLYQWVSTAIFKYDLKKFNDSEAKQHLFLPSDFNGKLADNEIIADASTLQHMLGKDDLTEVYDIIQGELSNRAKYNELVKKGYINFETDIHMMHPTEWVKMETRRFKIIGVVDFHGFIAKLEAKKMATIIENSGISLDSWRRNNFWELERIINNNKLEYVNPYRHFWSPIILNEKVFNEISPLAQDKVSELIVKLSPNTNYNEQFFREARDNNLIHRTNSGVVLGAFGDFADEAKLIFKYVSLVLALFTSVLLFSNISTSILNKKREIGTLRAIGARGKDVASIFVTEGLLLGVLTSILAIITLTIVTAIINVQLSQQMGLDLSIFNPSPTIIFEIIILSLTIVVVASFLPVKRVTLMKPIDAINNK
jgi:putative ABC transport system permease protein